MYVFLAFTIPFAVYLFTLSPSPFWLDSPELITSSHILGIPHPPGSPLYVILAKGASLIPIGSIPFRINLNSAVFGALSTMVLFLMLRRIAMERHGGSILTGLIPLLIALFFSVTYFIWTQSLNAEVYTLNLCANLLTFYMLISGRSDSRRAIVAFFIFGLSLGNHHYLALLTAPAMVFLLVTGRYEGGKATVLKRGFLFFVSALLVYAYLPARGAKSPEISWGDTNTISGFIDQVSARIFTASLGGFEQVNTSFSDNIALAVSLFLDIYSIWVFPFTLIGIFILLKSRLFEAFAAFLLFSCVFLSKPVMGILDPKNLDDYGYFLASGAMICLFAGVSVIEILGWVMKNKRGVTRAVFISLSLVPILNVSLDRARHSLELGIDSSTFYNAELFSEFRLNHLPGGSFVFSWYYPIYFMDMYSRLVSGFRGDLGVVQQSLYHKVNGGFYANNLKRLYPQLVKPLERYLETNLFPARELIELSSKSPLFFDIAPDLHFPQENLSSEGFVHRIVPAIPGTEAENLQKIVNIYSGFERKAGEYFSLDYETRRILLLKHIQNANYFFRNGFVESARLETSLAIKANPFDGEPVELKKLKEKAEQRKEDGQ